MSWNGMIEEELEIYNPHIDDYYYVQAKIEYEYESYTPAHNNCCTDDAYPEEGGYCQILNITDTLTGDKVNLSSLELEALEEKLYERECDD